MSISTTLRSAGDTRRARAVIDWLRAHEPLLHLAAALVAPLIVAAALSPLRDDIRSINVALVLVVVVVAVSARGRALAGVTSALGCAIWFDFFFTVPHQSFAIDNSEDLLTAALLATVGVAVAELAAFGRRSSTAVRRRRAGLDELVKVSDLVAVRSETDSVIERITDDISELLKAEACIWHHGEPAPDAGIITRGGAVFVGPVQWDVERGGLPTRAVIVAQHRGRSVGYFDVYGKPGSRVPVENRQLAVILADQAGAVLADSNGP